ncbi:hypothetical protein dsat_0662 [Alkalidesulfovibrio alkalitolerans DSM 16529]|uniref:Uncharacterized protein n=1 Tax=Alkalidesulfovibrio alkalitolerans DSM 16529 TaxID=1121439 RepID=S7T764_9BACT|nr:hypothetical protein [Alkalidesulfovibrio alkalitolerans]EPR32310.1 hypothetical protein dsat_0662 [Alkalidesulfovibrio alkalitolerans DSM 16529]
MLATLLVAAVALTLVICEVALGRPERFAASETGENAESLGCLAPRMSPAEAATRAVPLLLAGLGLPLAIAHPLPGLSCLTLAGALFALGSRLRPARPSSPAAATSR